jgi:glycosyltransferase involved in cell wall biosynthesis
MKAGTVVSITPIAVERDSRTFKQAASMTRLGYRSIVFEVEPSYALPAGLPFELITLGKRRAAPDVKVASDVDAANAVPTPDIAEAFTADAQAVLNADAASEQEPLPFDPAAEASPEPPGRFRIMLLLDDLALRAPTRARDILGPPWRIVLRWLEQLNVLRARMLTHWFTGQPFIFWGYLKHYARTCRSIAAELPPADVYYLHGHLHFPAVFWRTRFGLRPFIYDAHDLYWNLRRDGRTMSAAERAIWVVWDLIERLCAKAARARVTVGDGVARHAGARFHRRFAVVRNAHDARLDDADVRDVRARLQLSSEAFLLAVSGNYKRGMAVEPMLRALRLVPERVHVAFVGAHYEQFADVATALEVGERAHFLPPVPPTHIVPVLAGADVSPILYFPSSTSVRHALPNGFFHAVAAGVPVLYPRNLVDLRDIAQRHEIGWEIDPENDSSIARAILQIVDAREVLEDRRNRVAAARPVLSWETEEKRLATVVHEAMSRRRMI